MSRSLRLLALPAAALLLPNPSGQAQTPSFQGLGGFPGGSAMGVAYGASADGGVTVGICNAGPEANQAFRWTAEEGMINLGDLPGGQVYSYAFDVSADGRVAVGSGVGVGGPEAFRWTEAEGMVGLGDLPGGEANSDALGVSVDGSVVVGGGSRAGGLEAFRWTAAMGMIGLGVLPGDASSHAVGVSADGHVVVGESYGANGNEAFRWTQATGLAGLGDLPGGTRSSFARAVSSDGRVVVGGSEGASGPEAFLWTEEGGMVGLGRLPPAAGLVYYVSATGISADGRVVVGLEDRTSGSEAFIWTAAEGMRSLRVVLVELGLGDAVAGWRLTEAHGVSADGTTIVGRGRNEAGRLEAWRAVLGAPVATEEQPGSTATAALHAPAPNPSSSRVAFRFDVAEPGPVRLAIYDALGREVALAAEGERAAGTHEALLDASRLAPGVYLVRLTAGETTRTRRLAIAR